MKMGGGGWLHTLEYTHRKVKGAAAAVWRGAGVAGCGIAGLRVALRQRSAPQTAGHAVCTFCTVNPYGV